jgi:hypothetical protein
MKTQRKPYQVEVKRGTSRSAFISPSQKPDVFRKVEAQLFRVTQPDEPMSDGVTFKGTNPSRRILQAIEEPQTTLLPTSYEAPDRRGRKPGSKNKPKLNATVGVEGVSRSLRLDDGLPKRRGRPPGSKNQARQIDLPENARWSSLTPVEAQEHASLGNGAPTLSDLVGVTKRRGRPLGSKNKPKADVHVPSMHGRLVNAIRLAGVDVGPEELSVRVQSGAPATDARPLSKLEFALRDDGPKPAFNGPRLRDRSRILRRYVRKTEAKAGEKGFQRRFRKA